MPHIKRWERGFLILMVSAIFLLSVALILLMTRPAWPATSAEPQAYSCEDVRRMIAERGKVAAIAFAVEHGLSIRQIWQIRRTCKV
ncbi:hypothetical protein ABIB94_007102 [Bradyrhizobium sp. JR7.2]|uniref:hypothetical protein n=1 Tax=Bradyrhizobium sp. JR7.2 TaxID=3156375 RepID=UPI003392BACD